MFFRNPNYPHTTDRQENGKSSTMLDWATYDPTYKKYIQIGSTSISILALSRYLNTYLGYLLPRFLQLSQGGWAVAPVKSFDFELSVVGTV